MIGPPLFVSAGGEASRVRRLLITFAVVGYLIADLLVLWWLAGRIGWLWVIAILAVQFAFGVIIARRAGASAFRGLGEASRSGSLPDGTVGDSALTALGGVLLAVPGFISDIAAVLLFIPPSRRLIRSATGVTVGRRIQAAGFSTTTSTSADGITVTRLHEGSVIEGEVVREGDEPEAGSPT